MATKSTHTVVLQMHDGTQRTIRVRETAKSWVSHNGTQYDKRVGTVRSAWATDKLLFDTLKPIVEEKQVAEAPAITKTVRTFTLQFHGSITEQRWQVEIRATSENEAVAMAQRIADHSVLMQHGELILWYGDERIATFRSEVKVIATAREAA